MQVSFLRSRGTKGSPHIARSCCSVEPQSVRRNILDQVMWKFSCSLYSRQSQNRKKMLLLVKMRLRWKEMNGQWWNFNPNPPINFYPALERAAFCSCLSSWVFLGAQCFASASSSRAQVQWGPRNEMHLSHTPLQSTPGLKTCINPSRSNGGNHFSPSSPFFIQCCLC